MPRSNRPRRRTGRSPGEEPDLQRLLTGFRRTESKRDGLWNVQPVSGEGSVKVYTCPGCGAQIEPGTPHVVAWRADGIFGEEHDLAGRRHWHTRCWRIGP